MHQLVLPDTSLGSLSRAPTQAQEPSVTLSLHTTSVKAGIHGVCTEEWIQERCVIVQR